MSRALGTWTLTLVCLLLLPLDTVRAQQRVWRVEVPLARPAEQLARLRALELDVNAYVRKAGAAYLIVDADGLSTLRQLGFEPRIVEDVTPTDERIEALSDYYDEVESAAAVDRVAGNYPAIAMRLDYTEATAEGRSVSLLKISDNVATDEPERRILFVSQHHAREVMTPEVMVDMMDYLTQNYGSDPEVTAWVDNYEIYIVPSHNPDGTHHVFNANSNWRKNRRDNGDGTFGVDPNRNYDYRWGPVAGCGGSDTSTSSDTYHGPAAASEPETRGLQSLALDVRPAISLTYHTYGELVIHPFGCSPNLPDDPDRMAHREIGGELASLIVNDNGDGWYEMGTAPELLYQVDGDSDGYLHAVAGTVGFTIEMSTAAQGFQPDYATWRDDTVLRNRAGWIYLLRRLDGGGVTGEVRDACSGAGLEAEVGVVEQVFDQGQQPRLALPGHGFFSRVLMPGDYTLFADLGGYRRQEWPLSVGYRPERRDVWLVPAGSRGVELRSLRVDDAGGDVDGRADPGEEVDLLPTVLASGEAVTGLTASLSTDDVHVEIVDASATIPDLAAGTEAQAVDPFRVRILADAPDGHVARLTVSFSANETLCRDGDDADLRVTRGFPSCPFESESFDGDPGWTATGPGGGWEFGVPQGAGGNSGPDTAYSGNEVYATNLSGDYGSAAGDFVMSSTPFDLQGLRNAELRFRRWLNNEPAYDLARVEVSTDQVDWTEVWRGFGRDTGWEEIRVGNLPPDIDDAAQVWVRFALRQDGGGSRSGFYLDDVSFCGEAAPSAGGKIRYEAHTILEGDPNRGNADGAVDADETVTVSVRVRSTRDDVTTAVSAVLTTMDPAVTIHNNVAEFPDVQPGGAVESLAPHFSFNAGLDCAARIPFTLETRYENGLSTLSDFTVPVGSLEPGTLLDDDMETDIGWVVSGNATDGPWQYGDPVGNDQQGDPTNPEDDHTPDPGSFCWVTTSAPAGVAVPATQAEVDDGSTILTSPVLAAAAYDSLQLRYWRWFYQGAGPGPDTLRVEVTGDGINWKTVDELGSKANQWTESVHDLGGLVSPSDALQVRFVVTDAGGESIVEGGVDDVRLDGQRFVCDPFSPPLLDPPNPVGNTLRVDRAGFDVRLTWQAPPADASHGPATRYSVRRSGAAASGFAEVGAPTDPFLRDLGMAGPSAPDALFYLVTASNSGGSE
jgi:hypothetical protein